jgi:hypothetical protein
VHSGDRNFVPSGGSTKSLHLQKRAADLHIPGMTDGQIFAMIRREMNQLFDVAEAYEVIIHGRFTATGGPHIHIGRYGNGRGGYIDFKEEGLLPSTKGDYSRDRVRFTTPTGSLLNPSGSNTAFKAQRPGTKGVITGSVGMAGDNYPTDTYAVQQMLNLARTRLKEANITHEFFAPLVEDRIAGPDTIKAITIFQRDVLGWRNPDGRIDPNGNTLHALTIAAFNSPEVVAKELGKKRRLTPPSSAEAPGTYAWNGNLAWGGHANVSDEFRQKVMRIARELGIQNPSWLMSVMAFETSGTFRADIPNSAGSSGVGLIQFMRSTIDGRTDKKGVFHPGLGQKLGIRHSDLPRMTNVRQLDVVKAYFEMFGTKPARAQNVADLYFLVLYPKAFGMQNDDPLFVAGTKEYEQNNFDSLRAGGNNDGIVQVGEVSAKVRQMHQEGLTKFGFMMPGK